MLRRRSVEFANSMAFIIVHLVTLIQVSNSTKFTHSLSSRLLKIHSLPFYLDSCFSPILIGPLRSGVESRCRILQKGDGEARQTTRNARLCDLRREREKEEGGDTMRKSTDTIRTQQIDGVVNLDVT